MASILYIEEAVVTGDILSRRHGDESEVYIADSAIVTPTRTFHIYSVSVHLLLHVCYVLYAVCCVSAVHCIIESTAVQCMQRKLESVRDSVRMGQWDSMG